MEMTSANGDSSSAIKILFQHVPELYNPSCVVKCSYTIQVFDRAFQSSAGNWVGIFEVGWRSLKDSIMKRFVQCPDIKSGESQAYEDTVYFEGNMPKNDNFHQFCYISNLGKICGASEPFQFKENHVSSEGEATVGVVRPYNDPDAQISYTNWKEKEQSLLDIIKNLESQLQQKNLQTESLNRSEMDKTTVAGSEMKLSSPLVDLVAYVTKLENENQHLKELCDTYENEMKNVALHKRCSREKIEKKSYDIVTWLESVPPVVNPKCTSLIPVRPYKEIEKTRTELKPPLHRTCPVCLQTFPQEYKQRCYEDHVNSHLDEND